MPTSLQPCRQAKRHRPMSTHSLRPSRIILILFFVFAFCYGLYEAQGILLGPKIAVESLPLHAESQFIHIKGSATHIASISMNGADIPVTSAGAFDEPYLLGPGENHIELVAKDKYGNRTVKTLIYYYQSTSTTPLPAIPTPEHATATPATDE